MQFWIPYAAGIVVSLSIGCAPALSTRPMYHDPTTAIVLRSDSKAGPGHSHPAQITSETLQRVLNGIRVRSRHAFLPAILTGDATLAAAFSKEEQALLASHLSRALAQALPNELVTFYQRTVNSSTGLAITSGGLFVHNQHLYVILANNRTLPSEGMNQSIVSEIDPVENPLLPISRTSFQATFMPETSIVPEDERWNWPYIDPGRVVVIDLVQMARDLRSPASSSTP